MLSLSIVIYSQSLFQMCQCKKKCELHLTTLNAIGILFKSESIIQISNYNISPVIIDRDY